MLWFLSQKQIHFVVEKSLGQKVCKLTEKFEPDREKNWRGNWRLSIHTTQKQESFFPKNILSIIIGFQPIISWKYFLPFFKVFAPKSMHAREKTICSQNQKQKSYLQIENKTYWTISTE